MAKYPQFNSGFKFLFLDFSVTLTYKKPNIYSKIFKN